MKEVIPVVADELNVASDRISAGRRLKDLVMKQSPRFQTKEFEMLVLSRKATETIYLGDEIVLTVLSVKGSLVRLGINAPASILIRRAELGSERDSNSTEVLVPPPAVRRPR